MNNVELQGRLTKDCELRYTSVNNKPVASFTLAVNRPKQEGKEDTADFINVVAWGKLAEVCGKLLDKGKEVFVKGRWTSGSYEKDGRKVYKSDVTAEFVGYNIIDIQDFVQSNTPDNDTPYDDTPLPF